MTTTTEGPTRGAFEQADDTRWQASPVGAWIVRAAVVVSPIVGAFAGLLLLAETFIRPPGLFGLVLWFVQGLIVGTALSMTIERLGRGLLPLATLFSMSLVFPDQAPSRFGVALRSGTVKRLAANTSAGDDAKLLGDDTSTAAKRAIEYVASLGHHDRLTRGHTERVRAYADLIAGEMGLSPAEREKLSWGVMLHDIGKITVPAEILNKEAKLTDEEWQTLKGHPEAGARMLTPLREWLGPWALAAFEHHERWDGGGYPRGLAGTDISLAGRITAVADAYDVITSRRSYKDPMTAAAARRELVVCSGTQFDPDVVRAFLNVSLGRRWSAGLLATVSHLPIGNLGTAPAAVTVGVVATASSVAAGMAPPAPVEELAFEEPAPVVEVVEDLPPDEPVVSTTAEPAVPPPAEVVTPEPTTTVPPEEPTSSETPAPTTSTTAAPTTAAPTTPAPTTAPPPTTTVPPTTTTTAPTTTTTAPTTTTTAPTTTTTAPPGGIWYLDNPGGGGDTTAQNWKKLVLATPSGPLYNYDTNRDSIAGLRLQTTTNGWNEGSTSRIQRFFLDTGSSTISGPVTVRIWAANENPGNTTTLRASLADCPEETTDWWWSCTTPAIAEASATVTNSIADGFQELVFDLGNPSFSLAADRNLVLRFIAEGPDTVHTAFDSGDHQSRITMNLS